MKLGPSRVALATVTGVALTGAAIIVLALSQLSVSLASEPDPIAPTDPPARTTAAQTGSDGTWVVGRDLRPGTYKTTVPGKHCVWATLRGFSLTMEDVVDVGQGVERQRLTVTITPAIKGFETYGCGVWRR